MAPAAGPRVRSARGHPRVRADIPWPRLGPAGELGGPWAHLADPPARQHDDLFVLVAECADYRAETQFINTRTCQLETSLPAACWFTGPAAVCDRLSAGMGRPGRGIEWVCWREEQASVSFVSSHESGSTRPLIGFRLSVRSSWPTAKSEATRQRSNVINQRYIFARACH